MPVIDTSKFGRKIVKVMATKPMLIDGQRRLVEAWDEKEEFFPDISEAEAAQLWEESWSQRPDGRWMCVYNGRRFFTKKKPVAPEQLKPKMGGAAK